MHDDWTPDDLTLRFLLGELEESERCRLEDRCLADDDYFEQVVRAEEWLVEGFVRGSLSAELCRRFDVASRTSSRRAVRVRLERVLQRSGGVMESTAPAAPGAAGGKVAATARVWGRRPALRFALAAAAGLAAVALAATFAMLNHGLQGRLTQAEADLAHTREHVNRLERDSRRDESGGAVPATQVAVLALEPGLLRGDAEPPRLILDTDIRLVWLQLRVAAPAAHREYRVLVLTPEGQELARLNHLAARATAESLVVDVPLPAALLAGRTAVLARLVGLDPGEEPEDLGAYGIEISR